MISYIDMPSVTAQKGLNVFSGRGIPAKIPSSITCQPTPGPDMHVFIQARYLPYTVFPATIGLTGLPVLKYIVPWMQVFKILGEPSKQGE
jgi:hypothetical protein